MRDLHNNIAPVVVLAPLVSPVANNDAQVGSIVSHAGYDSAEYIICTGVLGDAGAEFTVLLEEGDLPALGDAAAVADKDLLGTEALASFTQASDGKVFKLGYVGTKLYTRMTITPTNNGTAAPMSAVCILGHPRVVPTANPPA